MVGALTVEDEVETLLLRLPAMRFTMSLGRRGRRTASQTGYAASIPDARIEV